jgi:6-pyruvoyltetrahydropterin/6-carboxytetrahydropterin synthase
VTFQVGAGVAFHASHRQPVAGPEGELHSHEYRLEVVVERGELDSRGMVCDLDLLNAALREVVGQIEGQDLEVVRPADAEAVTVEVLSRWAHGALAEAVRLAGGEVLLVRVYESPFEFGGYRGPVAPAGPEDVPTS